MDRPTTLIRPRTCLFEIDFGELWRYRDLLALFVKRNVIVQYKQTVLGPLWFFIQPALTVCMYGLVFGGIAGIPTDGVPPFLFYLAGLCFWQYFADCLTKTSNSFVDNAGLFGKVYFPRLVMPLAHVLSNLLRLGIQGLLLAAVYLAYVVGGMAVRPNLYVLLSPLLVLLLMGLSLGSGLVLSSLTTKYRDLQILFTFVVQLWMYASPVVYPLSQVRGKHMAGLDLYRLLCLNPVTPLLETFKHGLLGAGDFVGWAWLFYSLGFVVALLFAGLLLFNRVQRNFMDTV